jgi:hypothetical protein
VAVCRPGKACRKPNASSNDGTKPARDDFAGGCPCHYVCPAQPCPFLAAQLFVPGCHISRFLAASPARSQSQCDIWHNLDFSDEAVSLRIAECLCRKCGTGFACAQLTPNWPQHVPQSAGDFDAQHICSRDQVWRDVSDRMSNVHRWKWPPIERSCDTVADWRQ